RGRRAVSVQPPRRAPTKPGTVGLDSRPGRGQATQPVPHRCRRMRCRRRSPVRILHVPPPYAAIQEFDPGAGRLSRGSVLVLDVQVPIDAAQAEIEAVVRELRRRHSVALALRVPEFRGAGPAWTVAWGYRLGIRAFVSAGE